MMTSGLRADHDAGRSTLQIRNTPPIASPASDWLPGHNKYRLVRQRRQYVYRITPTTLVLTTYTRPPHNMTRAIQRKIDTRWQALRWRLRLGRSNPKEPNRLDLATELVLLIYSFFPVPEQVCLAMSCKTFYGFFKFALKHEDLSLVCSSIMIIKYASAIHWLHGIGFFFSWKTRAGRTVPAALCFIRGRYSPTLN